MLDLPSSSSFVVAFSGGADSLALLLLMGEEERRRCTAIYVDHNIRERAELDREVELNRKNCLALGIPLVVHTLPPGLVSNYALGHACGTEAAARALRYSALEEYRICSGADFILTAHHRDDQMETVLMRMKEGSPFWAWGGIRKRTGHVLRPLLAFSKAELLSVTIASGLVWSEDSTNTDTSYRRNWIRKNILPSISSEASSLLLKIASNVEMLDRTPAKITFRGTVSASFDTDEYLSLLPPGREATLFSLFSILSPGTRITRGLIREIDEGIREGRGRRETDSVFFRFLPRRMDAYARVAPFSSEWKGVDTVLPHGLSVVTLPSDPLALSLPEEALEGAVLRLSSPSDSIMLLDGRRKVSSLLKEHRIPYALVLEKEGAVIAFFSSFLGGRDRLCRELLGKNGVKYGIAARSWGE